MRLSHIDAVWVFCRQPPTGHLPKRFNSRMLCPASSQRTFSNAEHVQPLKYAEVHARFTFQYLQKGVQTTKIRINISFLNLRGYYLRKTVLRATRTFLGYIFQGQLRKESLKTESLCRQKREPTNVSRTCVAHTRWPSTACPRNSILLA